MSDEKDKLIFCLKDDKRKLEKEIKERELKVRQINLVLLELEVKSSDKKIRYTLKERTEMQLIQSVLNENYGNRRVAADLIGITVRTIYRKIDQYNIIINNKPKKQK